MIYRSELPASYLAQCERTGHKPITADYAVWLITVRKVCPAVVPAYFTTEHLDKLPLLEQKRWIRTARRRSNKERRNDIHSSR